MSVDVESLYLIVGVAVPIALLIFSWRRDRRETRASKQDPKTTARHEIVVQGPSLDTGLTDILVAEIKPFRSICLDLPPEKRLRTELELVLNRAHVSKRIRNLYEHSIRSTLLRQRLRGARLMRRGAISVLVVSALHIVLFGIVPAITSSIRTGLTHNIMLVLLVESVLAVIALAVYIHRLNRTIEGLDECPAIEVS